jgi:hypothetical protein
MPKIDLSMLNQRQTPAFYADVLANRPAAGFIGRIFVSTNTYAFYRDNGTGWDLIGGPGTGTITGSGAAGQVSFWNGASTITGENNLWWDSANNHLGINTNTPATALDVNHNGTLVAKFNNTTSANTLVAFENAGNEQWWIGTENTNNDFLFYDATNFPTLSLRTTFKTNGQVLIGGGSTGSGKLVVESATSDNGIQIVGANAPSLRIDSAATGPTKRIGLGISTGVNNFIQGSVDRDMCIFNGSTTPSPILFGVYATTNVQEAARISSLGNLLVNTTVDNGKDFQVSGTGSVSSSFSMVVGQIGGPASYNEPNGTNGTLQFGNYTGGYLTGNIDNYIYKISGAIGSVAAQSLIFQTRSDVAAGGFAFIVGTTPRPALRIDGSGDATFSNSISGNEYLNILKNGSDTAFSGPYIGVSNAANNRSYGWQLGASNQLSLFYYAGGPTSNPLNISAAGNTLIGTTTDAGQKLQVNGDVLGTGFVTTRGIISVAPLTNTTFFNGSASSSGLYIARVYLGGNTTSVWDAAIIFIYDVNDIAVINQTNGTNVSTIVSGTNVQIRQIGGTTYDFNYDIIRIR